MSKTTILTETFQIDGENNPLNVNATIAIESEFGEGHNWEVTRINWIELVIGDKEGIDLTKQILSNARAKELITSQVADCEDAIYEALGEKESENV